MDQELGIRKERLQLLLQQISFPDKFVDYFKDGYISKLTVYKETRKWHFDFHFPEVLPFHVYDLFRNRLQDGLRHIAEVTYSISTDGGGNEELAAAYWQNVVELMQDHSASLTALLKNQAPKISGNKLFVTVRNETEAAIAKRKLSGPLTDCYLAAGFPKYMLEIEVKESEQDYKKFVEQKQQEDQSKMMEALIEKQKADNAASKGQVPDSLVIGYKIKEEPVPIETIQDEERRIAVQGYVFHAETKELRSGRTLLTFKITDYTDSILVKMFSRDKEDVPILEAVRKGIWVKVRGGIQNDTFVRDLVMIGNDLTEIKPELRKDESPEDEKRIELHAHTQMSQMDSVSTAGSLIAQAAKWGHPAIAITDHNVVQSFPDAYAAGQKNNIKVIYGLEADLVDDGVPMAYNETDRDLESGTYIVFDVETTGLSAVYNKIIELAAVKLKDGEIVDKFERFANPHHPLSSTTIELTGITDDMVMNAPEIEDVIKDFHEFMGDDILVAHNASFDMGFLNVGLRNIGLGEATNPVIDTLELARFLYPEMRNHRLNTLCKKFDIDLTQHHRAIYDAEATGYLLWKLVK
ncbi:MAG: exonuclease domain-containing protein, partial [Anaerobacillus sp.]